MVPATARRTAGPLRGRSDGPRRGMILVTSSRVGRAYVPGRRSWAAEGGGSHRRGVSASKNRRTQTDRVLFSFDGHGMCV